ncbi:MAG TPA: hypothetical protein VMX13_06805 [Sedimentisphaerales bacterium]|nr:hypothetical protein [Sedimentisphaerales bacterium]
MSKAIVTAVIISVCVLAVVFMGRKHPLSLNERKTQPAKEKLPRTTGPIGNHKTSEVVIAGNTIADARFEEFIQWTGEEIVRDSRNRTDLFLRERDPRQFVTMSWETEAPYTEVKRIYKPDSLPEFYALLEDEHYAPYWPQMARIISFIGDDERSVPVILSYVTRAYDLVSLDGEDLGRRCAGKIQSIKWIGLIGGEEADKTLRQALTRDGARELIKEWIDGPLPHWASASRDNKPQGRLIEKIQGYAAMGIVYSQNQQSLRLVEELYDKAHTERVLNNRGSTLCSRLREAMANHHLIEAIGIKEYCNLLGGDGENYWRAITPYREAEERRHDQGESTG